MDDDGTTFREKNRDRCIESRGKRQNLVVEFRQVTDHICHADLTQTLALALVVVVVVVVIIGFIVITVPDTEEMIFGGFESSDGVSDGGCDGGETM